MPLSGGKDSTYCLYLAVRELGLRCLAVTLDNSYLSDHARRNIDRACRILGVEHILYRVDPHLMRELFALFMRKTGYFCSVCLRGIGMVQAMAADLYRAPLILGGTCARTELPLTPAMFQPGPAAYVRNVLRGEAIVRRCGPLLYEGSLRQRLGHRLFWWGSQRRLRLCAFINLPDYVEWNYDTIYRTIRNEVGWEVPPGSPEHADCEIHGVSVYLHDRRFPGLQIRRLTLARLIMAGQVSREDALRELSRPEGAHQEAALERFLHDTGMTREEFDRIIDGGPRHLDYVPRPSRLWLAVRGVKRAIWRALGLRKP